MRIIKRRLTIIDFIRHPLILNDQTMSPSQAAFLKSLMDFRSMMWSWRFIAAELAARHMLERYSER